MFNWILAIDRLLLPWLFPLQRINFIWVGVLTHPHKIPSTAEGTSGGRRSSND
jgi:hypothetical protein